MSSTVIQELGKDNLCTYFVLPLLRLNKFSFMGSNFINAYLTKDSKYVAVQVYDTVLITQMVSTHPGYQKTELRDGFFYFIFLIAPKWRHDVDLFKEGKFSKMSKAAREIIYQWSGLDYKKQDGHKVHTDMRLLALVKHPSLRRMWEKEFDIDFGPDDELLERPPEKSYITL